MSPPRLGSQAARATHAPPGSANIEGVTRRRVLAARVLAVVADGLQLGLFPLFVGGGLSVVNNVLDVLVAGGMIALVGWHWAFLPTFLAELVPGLDLVPTWTMAALLATGRGATEVPVAPEPTAPAGPTASADRSGAPPASALVIDVTPVTPGAPEPPPEDGRKNSTGPR